MVRVAMRHTLQGLADHIQWFEAADAADVRACLRAEPDLDLALVDLAMPGAGGAPWIGTLRQEFPVVPLVVMSATEDAALVRQFIDWGVAGFIPKSDRSEVITHAVRLVLAGGTYAPLRLLGAASSLGAAQELASAAAAAHAPDGLTDRQADVLRSLARGLPNKLIARELGISEGTVKAHVLAILRVFRAHNRTEAVVRAREWLQAKEG